VERRGYDAARLFADDVMRDPLVAALFRHGDVRQELSALLDLRPTLLRRLDELDQVLNHHDYWPPNLFLLPDGGARRTVAIDWAYTGIGAVAEDAGNVVLDAVSDGYFPCERTADLDEAVFDGYLSGLRDVGCDLDRDLVRFAYTMAACTKYFWLPAYMVQVVLEHRARPHAPASVDLEDTSELETLVHRRAYSVAFIASTFAESRALADRLGRA
jgi:hypothetical protein